MRHAPSLCGRQHGPARDLPQAVHAAPERGQGGERLLPAQGARRGDPQTHAGRRVLGRRRLHRARRLRRRLAGSARRLGCAGGGGVTERWRELWFGGPGAVMKWRHCREHRGSELADPMSTRLGGMLARILAGDQTSHSRSTPLSRLMDAERHVL